MVSPKNYKRRPLAVAMSLTTGKQNEAMLLCEIWDFYIRSHAEHKGRKVIIHTDEQLCERTGLSFYQLRRAKARLCGWRYIETWVAISEKYHGGLAVSHLHIPETLLSIMEGAILGTVQICAAGTEQNRIGRFVQGCSLSLYIEEVSKGNTPSNVPTAVFDELEQLNQLKEMFNG